MPQKEYYRLGEQIAAEAWAAFDRFCKEYDPEGNMDTLDLAEAYDQFAATPPPSNGDGGGAA